MQGRGWSARPGIVYQPVMQTTERGQKDYQYTVVTEKNPVMLGLCLIGSVVLVVLTVVYMLLLSKYIIEHRQHSVITGEVEALIYILLFVNIILALGLFYVATGDEATYKEIEVYLISVAIVYLAIHIIGALIWLILGLSQPHFMTLLGLLIFPALGELAVFGATVYGFYSLYRKTSLLLLPGHISGPVPVSVSPV